MTNEQLSALTDLLMEEMNKRLLQGEQAWIVVARETEAKALEVIADIESGKELVEALNNEAAEAWSLPKKLQKLNVTAPPDWNEYDAYLLSGGKLEYEEWRGDRND